MRQEPSVIALAQPTLRAGYDNPPYGAPGSTLWRGPAQQLQIRPGERRPIWTSLLVPDGVALPDPPQLDFVWTVVDAGIGIDEEKTALTLR